MTKSKKLFSYVAAFITVCLNSTFICRNMYADVGYIMLENKEYLYGNKSIPEVNSVLNKEELNPRYLFESIKFIDKIVYALGNDPIECHEKIGFNNRGKQMFSAVFDINLFFTTNTKNCGFQNLLIKEKKIKSNYTSFLSENLKKFKIISYYYNDGYIFAMVEYSFLKDHPLNKSY